MLESEEHLYEDMVAVAKSSSNENLYLKTLLPHIRYDAMELDNVVKIESDSHIMKHVPELQNIFFKLYKTMVLPPNKRDKHLEATFGPVREYGQNFSLLTSTDRIRFFFDPKRCGPQMTLSNLNRTCTTTTAWNQVQVFFNNFF
jgi:hypothetical protein